MAEQATTQDEPFDVFAHRDEVDGVDDDQNTDLNTDQSDEETDQDDPDGGDEGVEDELEDFEEDGKTYKVPKDLKGHLLRNQDYTRKTQALAAERKALEAEVAKVREDDEAMTEARLSLRQVQSRMSALEALTGADWDAIRSMDARDGTDRYGALQREFLTLPREAEKHKTTLDEKANEASRKQQEITARQVEEGQAILQRDIPGWGPELGAKLVSFVKDEYGIDEKRHGAAFLDPALVKMAHAAYKAKESQRKAATTKKIEQVTKNAPPKTAKSAAPQSGLRDDLPTDEWARRRNEQLAKRR